MGRLTLHARIEIALAAALLLGSCNSAALLTRDQVVDIADDSIDASGINARVDALDSRITEIESKLKM